MRHAIAAIALVVVLGMSPAIAEEASPRPCNEDAMIVFDASGSMSGTTGLGIGTFITGSTRSGTRCKPCCRMSPSRAALG